MTKSLLVLTSASSFLHSLTIIRNSYPEVLLVIRVWALPSLGAWLAAALVLYQYRILERRRGSSSFMSYVVLSGTLSMALFGALMATRHKTGLPLMLIPGALVYSMVGLLTLDYITTISPSHSHLGSLPLSSNLPLYLFASLFSASSISSVALTASGLLGGLIVRATGVSLPRPPSWVVALGGFLARDPPPKRYSGASLSVQAQQRTDEIEQLMASMYTRQQQRQSRRIVIGRPVRQQIPPPPEEQVERLRSMGFSQQESIQALQYTGNNIDNAIRLLTARRT